MDERLRSRAAALELDHRLYRRAAEEVTVVAHGFAVRHRALSAVYALNAVVLTESPTDSRQPSRVRLQAPVVARLADEILSDLPHRRVVIDDERAGARLRPDLNRLGYEALRIRYMALRPDAAPPVADPRARKLTDDQLAAIQLAVFAEDKYGPHAFPELAALLMRAQVALRAGTDALGFGAGPRVGDVRSTATLFCDPDVDGRRVAMVEQVATLRADREQGLGRAVVTAAVRAACEWDAELVVVPVDADDWPQLMYAKLGFTAVGEAWTFTRVGLGSAGWPR